MSLAATPLAKETVVEDPNQVIGLRARILTHLLNKYKSMFIMNRITLLIIDQVRSNIQIESRFAPANEKTVGTFTNLKAATNVNALQHSISQWLFFSKKTSLFPNDGLGLDGWILQISTEKNKLAPSHYDVHTVFDKKYGIIPLLSEYYFMGNMSSWEKKITKNDDTKLCYPLCVETVAHSKVITVYDPADPKKIIVQTEKFTEKTLMSRYNTDARFKAVFELALKYSIQERILKGYFREIVRTKTIIEDAPAHLAPTVATPIIEEEPQDQTYLVPDLNINEELAPQQDFDTETGEIYEPEPEPAYESNEPEPYYVDPDPDSAPSL